MHFCLCCVIIISIHALRGEGDDFKPDTVYDFVYISIHALRGEGDKVVN